MVEEKKRNLEWRLHKNVTTVEYSIDDEENKTCENEISSNQDYYWHGKDYSNCYKADFQKIEEFGVGKCFLKSRIFTLNNCEHTQNFEKINSIVKKYRECRGEMKDCLFMEKQQEM